MNLAAQQPPRAWAERPSAELSLIAAGPWDHGEFSLVREAVDPHRRWQVADTLEGAIDAVTCQSTPPELMLYAQPRPTANEQRLVDQLHRAAPLTRMVVVAGSWCEGELRTGRPLTGVVRLYWHEFPAWWRVALNLWSRGLQPPWSEPLSSPSPGRRAMLGGDANSPSSAVAESPSVAINTADYSAFEAISHGLAAFGWSCVWQPRRRGELDAQLVSSIAAGIWDGGQLDGNEQPLLAKFCRQLAAHRAPALTLLDFPRAENFRDARRAGAAAVLGKPYQLALLSAELARLTRESAVAAR